MVFLSDLGVATGGPARYAKRPYGKFQKAKLCIDPIKTNKTFSAFSLRERGRSQAGSHYNRRRRSRNAFVTTDTELRLMAALAITGLSNMPKKGYSTPAATGTPSTL
jgi:hypothetical protein